MIQLAITLMTVLLAPVLLVGLALAVVEVRTALGGCPAHRRHAWLGAARHSVTPGPAVDRAGMLLR